jgi:hypothetical protein
MAASTPPGSDVQQPAESFHAGRLRLTLAARNDPVGDVGLGRCHVDFGPRWRSVFSKGLLPQRRPMHDEFLKMSWPPGRTQTASLAPEIGRGDLCAEHKGNKTDDDDLPAVGPHPNVGTPNAVLDPRYVPDLSEPNTCGYTHHPS